VLRGFSNLFFPHICYACGRDVSASNQLLCLRCLHLLPYTRFEEYSGNPVEKIFWGRIPIQDAASIFYFTKDSIIERLLYHLKYRGRKEVGVYCGRLVGAAIDVSQRFSDVDAIIPLPLFAKKEHQRGFNQAKLLCDGIGEVINKPVLTNVMIRTEATKTQTHKNRIERWENMRHRFNLGNADMVRGKHVVLVDDVITTGATLESCAQELLKVSDLKLSILTLAYSSSRNV